MQDPDLDIIQAAKAGDNEAFDKLVNRYYEMVYAVSFGVLNERESSRDVAQEVFIKVFRELQRFEGKSKFKTWLYRITVNSAIDQSRKKRLTQTIDATDASDDPEKAAKVLTDTKPGPRDRASQAELGQLIQKAMTKLSEDHRAVLVLREFQELSYEEIAETLDIGIGTVMSRLYYARKKMAEILGIQMEKKDHERLGK